MKQGIWNKVWPHLAAIGFILLTAIIYCSPALQGKVLQQSDITHWNGMVKALLDYQQSHNGQFPFWTPQLFGGMPAFLIAFAGNNIPAMLYNILTLGLPEPASIFFLAGASFYLLAISLKVRPIYAVLGALAFAYATYNPIIIAVGHITKAKSIALMPLVLAGVLQIYHRKYALGTAITALTTSVLIAMNHLQIDYYLFLIIAIATLFYTIQWIKEKSYKHLFLAVSLAAAGGIIGVASNAINLLTLFHHQKETIRGGASVLNNGENKGGDKAGLDKEYAFGWSQGIGETATLIVPNAFGGSSSGEIKENGKTYETLTGKGVPADQAALFLQQLPGYWGPQPFTSGPVYFGIITLFLCLLCFIIPNEYRWWLLTASILGLVLAWGKNFSTINYFLFDYLPLYNKFRAPAMALVIPQLLLPLGASIGLELFFKQDNITQSKQQLKLLSYGAIAFAIIGAFLYLTGSFSGEGDTRLKEGLQQMTGDASFAQDVVSALIADRKGLFYADFIRMLALVGAAFALIWAYQRQWLKQTMIIGLGLVTLMAFDVFSVAARYLKPANYIEKEENLSVFIPNEIDKQILADKDPHFRVFNLTTDAFNDAITCYHHRSIAGYHPAKLRIYQDLIEQQLSKPQLNIGVLNMLDTKYLILPGQNGQPVLQQNPGALGAAWFVKHIKVVDSPAAEMTSLDNLNTKDTAVVQKSFAITQPTGFDSTATVQLISSDFDALAYTTESKTPGFVVFSEVYYNKGWKVTIDEEPASFVKTNYVLRGMNVPAGKHNIKFVFEPTGYQTGKTMSMLSNIALLLLLVWAGFSIYQQRKK